jgi:peptide/nickel transport system permease protein
VSPTAVPSRVSAARTDVELPPRRRLSADIARSLRRARLAPFGLLILLVLSVSAILAGVVAPHNPNAVDVVQRLKPPFWQADGSLDYLLGTDSVGRDVLSRIVYGARIALAVGAASVVVSGCIGVCLGLAAGYWRGWVDAVISRVAEIQLAFPFILLAISVLAVVGPGVGNVIFVLGTYGWVIYARVVRAQTLSWREKEFVEAARCIGVSDTAIMLRHILPNVLAPIIVIASFSMATNVLAEASLSFLGLGVPLSIPSWGAMLADARDYLQDAWWLATFPGLALMLTVLGINVVGDWLRDFLDPRLRL